MTPLSESAYEDVSSDDNSSHNINLQAAFGSADEFSKNSKDIYYKLSSQQELVWSYEGEKLDSKEINKMAPIAFFKVRIQIIEI